MSSLTQSVVALASLFSVTALAWQGIINGDAAVGFFGAVLGYAFGRATTSNGA